MYEAYWRLHSKPFEELTDATACFPVESQQAAILKLRYALESQRPAALLVGPVGAGKTALLRMLEAQLPESLTPRVNIVFPRLSAGELLTSIASGLVAEPAPPGVTIEQTVRTIEGALRENDERGQHAVVIIDEAHLLRGSSCWESLRLLLNFTQGASSLLTLVLCGQPTLLPRLARMPQWEERLAVKCLLRPFNADETAAYVRHRLFAAGAQRDIFDQAALDSLHSLSGGLPRRINRLCDLALLIAFAEEAEMVTTAHIDSVTDELLLRAA